MARWSPWRRRRATEYREERVATAAPPPRPRPFWPWLLLLLLLVLGALGASWYLSNRGETVDAEKVPDVVGAQRPEAEQRLQDRNFESEVKRVVSPRRPGTVVAQRPEPGRLYGEGGIVVLSVARDPLKTEVPDVSGLSTARALARLRAVDLRPRAQAVQSKEPKGRVLRQLPAPGTEVPRGSPALVVVSSGPELATVPNVVGASLGQATARVSQAGFRVRVVRVPGTQPEGTVVAQNPSGRARALSGTVVRLNVSMGPGGGTTTVVTTATTEAQATVPDTVGQDEATARGTLEGAGFTVRAVDRPTADPNQDGIVINQSPAGGARARSGSTVTIFVGRLS
ncbi:MAG TPA: PASTA domain-containing protein [Gaiellaceae bacterium]|nr:PASTA domain-containing protein [Gaiellaceae bacterium]